MTPSLRLQAIFQTVSPLKYTMIVPSSAKQHITTTATMASESGAPTAAPWRAQFLSDISKMNQPTFTLASLHSSSSSTVPRARTCIYRGLWASLTPNDKNKAPRNPALYESDMLVLTTDARMDKVPEIFSSGQTENQISHSGGGGPVEAMFWAVPTQTQWRIRGHAWVLSAADIESSCAAAKAVRETIQARMRRRDGSGSSEESGEKWTWEKEIVGHFGNLSPGMRGSFKNPSPGMPRANKPGPGESLGQKVGDELLEDEVAKRNFRVVVVVPDELDLVDLSDSADQRRWLHKFVGTEAQVTMPGGVIEGQWEIVELWP